MALKALLAMMAAPAMATAAQAHQSYSRRGALDGSTLFLRAERDTLAAEFRRNPNGSLLVSDRVSGRARFAVKVPPLRYLWISPDERYIVGLGEGRTWDAVVEGVTVYTADGRLLLEEILTPSGPERALFSDGQWSPQLGITEGRGGAILTVKDRTGGLHAFDLPSGER